jgi:hypothetical protein
MDKFIRCSQSHSASAMVVSNVVSYASLVDHVKMVCLQDFHEIVPPPSEDTYPMMV